MKSNKIYQASTLQALALGYTKPVVTVRELLEHGDTGSVPSNMWTAR